MQMKPALIIISPSLADANTGNWRTAERWANFLADGWDVDIQRDWPPEGGRGGAGGPGDAGGPVDAVDAGDSGRLDRPRPQVMIALHARRSADAIARFAATGRPVALVLTGTDLYRDIRSDASAQRSLELAQALVCLQERGPDELPAALRAKTRVIYQSAEPMAPMPSAVASDPPGTRAAFDLLLVGHLRPEKDPLTAMRAMALLDHPSVRLLQVGDLHDPSLREPVQAAAAADPRIRLLGPLAHDATRELIRRGRLLLLPSRMEGGANVLIEAVTSGVPVLGSRIPGSVGMLGEDYPGWFPVGDAAALAALIGRCIESPAFMATLRAHCARHAGRFLPSVERAEVRRLADDLQSAQRPMRR
jgi:putative glycosyltransferase (TIGR04348 family)